MVTPSQPKQFWITNTSNRDVSLGDLYLTVRAYKSVNLLDSKHYYYTWEQICRSLESGSLFKKRDKVVVRKQAPRVNKKTLLIDKNSIIPNREKSIFEIKQEKFEELEVTDEQFAAGEADLIKQ
jgi:hypothetical protein